MSLNFLSTNVLFGEPLTLPGPAGAPIDLGYVGTVTRVDRLTIDNLTYAGQVPVIPSMAMGPDNQKLNVNADTAATAVAAAIGAEKLVILSDIPGVLQDVNDPESLVHSLIRASRRSTSSTVACGIHSSWRSTPPAVWAPNWSAMMRSAPPLKRSHRPPSRPNRLPSSRLTTFGFPLPCLFFRHSPNSP